MTVAEITPIAPAAPSDRRRVRDAVPAPIMRLARQRPGALIAGIFLAALAISAIFAPLVAPYGPYVGTVTDRLLGLGKHGHLLGTDDQGRDILSRLIWGARPSLLEGIIPVAFAGLIGGSLGVIAGLATRRVHSVIMRSLDVLYSFPAVLLAIALAAALGAGTVNAILALTIVLIAPIARVTDTEVARIRSADFMEAANASGASRFVIAVKQVVPVILPPILVYCTALVGLAIVFAGGLSFLGLGVAPPQPEWGAMLNELDNDLYNAPVITLVPAIMIFVTSVAFNVLGDGLRELLDVRNAERS